MTSTECDSRKNRQETSQAGRTRRIQAAFALEKFFVKEKGEMYAPGMTKE